ncbi:hypothetical protein CBR_g12078 [Chara braunii]|uniref:Peptidase A2 domain-containing protein n=1 Tax=Chara braunii TaxID=69332 RepID=A0A388KR42_CHABU|nr:hypothetical protein CBR_g12078 [Chara braunii]|eukprot:GBG72507.1 hypothetical protein CBR_g12078 [Chara braunii]
MVKRYCMVEYKEEVSELEQASRDWPDFKAKLLDKYQLGDQLLDLADLRKVNRRKFGTAKQFLTEFERVARLVPDLPDKDRCLIFLEKFSEVEQRELMKDMTGRYDWPKIKENLLAGSFLQMLYRLLKQQKENREKEGVSEDKDQAVYKTLTDMRNMMADMKEERYEEGKALVKSSGRIMEEVDKEATRNRRHRPLLSNPNLRHEAEAEVEVEDKALGEAEEMGAAEAIGRIGFASIMAKMGMGYSFVNDKVIYTNIRGEVYDFEGNLIDPNVEGGMRKEAFRRMGRDLPTTFRLTSPEEVEQIELEAAMESLTIEDAKAGDEGLSKEQEEILQRAQAVVRKMTRCRETFVQVCADMNEEWSGLPQVFLFGGWDRDGQGGLTDVTTSQPGSPSAGRLMATTVLSRPAFKRHATAGLPQARRARRPPRPRAAPKEGPSQPRESVTIAIEEDDGKEDELLRAEDERQAKQRAMERKLETGKTDVEEGELKKKKHVYTIPVEPGLDIEQIVDQILESQRGLFTLKEFLVASPKIREEFKHRLSRKKVMTVKMSDIFPQEISWAPHGTKMDWHCVATGLLKVQVGPCEYSAPIDDGAEMNIIREREALGAGVNINRADTGFLVGASGITPFCGTTSDVVIQVGKVKVRSYFYVLPRVVPTVLLGRVFLCRSESIIFNKHDGTMIVVLCDPVCGYYEVMKCENTRPTNSRNRLNPGSYSFTESERLRREKESLGEESDPQKFSLALPYISQAIEFVATESSVDPKLVQTLTEIVAGEGETARVEHLRKLVRKNQEWEWGPKQQAAVDDIKAQFREGGLILGVPCFDNDPNRPFVVEADADPTTLGGVLIQKDGEGRERPLRFESRTLNEAERKYSQFKKGTLAVLHCLRIFRNYVFGRRFVLRVDPTALAQSLKNYSPSEPTIARWLIYVWMFDFEIERIAGAQNRADGLSQIE